MHPAKNGGITHDLEGALRLLQAKESLSEMMALLQEIVDRQAGT